MKDIVKLKAWERRCFLEELEETNLKNNFKFLLNDVLARNIDIFFELIIKNQIKKIIFRKVAELDQICLNIFAKYIQTYFLYLDKNIEFVFEDFSEDFLWGVLGYRNYLIYCEKNNFIPKWIDILLKNEKEKISKHDYLNKYTEFDFLSKEFIKHPFSYFTFIDEKGKNRFVYYFHVYSKKSENQLLKMLERFEFDFYATEFVQSIGVNTIISYYGLGFSYEKGKLTRKTLYLAFFNPYDIVAIFSFFKNRYQLDMQKYNVKNVWYYGVDFYESFTELKIYEESYVFDVELEDKDILNVFRNKHATKVLKFKDNKLSAEKFEFNIKKDFDETQKGVLISKGLYNNDYKLLAIYVKNKKIMKHVLYEL